MRYLVTGGAGFIGSEFVRQAVKKGSRVAVVDKLTYAGDLQRLSGLKITFYKNDIADCRKIKAVFDKEKPDVVVHFAAETHVDRSILSSAEFIATNIQGTQILLDAARQTGVKKFVHISTDEVYGDILTGQFQESTPLNPSSPYSASKAAGDLLVKSYMRTFNFPAIIIRPSNNYGPWQYPEKFIPVIIYKALKDERIPIYAKGENVREWLFVSDCTDAIAAVMQKGIIGETYNLGSGNERKNLQVALQILDILDKPHNLIEFVQDRPGHDIRYSLDSGLLTSKLGWQTKVTFEQGLEKTVAWYKDNLDWVENKAKYLQRYWKKVYKK